MSRLHRHGVAISGVALTTLLAALPACTTEPAEEASLDLTRSAATALAADRNLARDPGVVATAQSSYSGYAAARTVDGDLTTTVGPQYSWANAHASAPDGRLPQWLEVDLPDDRAVVGFNVYTSSGYPLQNYDLQAWNGTAWTTLLQQRGNRALQISHTIAEVTTRKIRLIGLRGPENQPEYARVNELQILGHDVAPAPTTTVLASGADWQRVQITAGGAQPVDEVLNIVTTGPNVAGAPLPQSLKDDLASEPPDQTVVISDWVAQDIATSESTGVLTARLQQIAEPDDAFAFTGSCSDVAMTKSRTLSFSGPVVRTTNEDNAIVGKLEVSAGITASVNAEVRFRKKRAKVLWWCIPYGTAFDGGDLVGQAEVDQGATIEGSVRYSKNFDWGEIRNVDLGGVWFFVGPVPVYLKFTLPITAGLRLSAQASSSVRYNGSQKGTASFSVHCNGSCTGSGGWNLTRQPGQPLLNADLSARIKVTPWLGIAGRVALYNDVFAYIQAGVRPELAVDLWGYTGSNCGDADQQNGNEPVRALTADLDGTLVITAGAGALGGGRSWDLWSHTWHLLWASLISDSSSRQTIVTGPAAVTTNVAGSYGLSMRPCWPYDDTVTYEITGTDGPPRTAQGAAHTSTAVSIAWPTAGTKLLSVRAVSDGHGRSLGATTGRSIQVTGVVNRNLSRDAGVQASAQTTFPGYAAARTIDGDTNTTVGPDYGWANDWGASLPQWMQVNFAAPRIVEGFNLYTSASYEIQNYDIQAWNGAAWVTVVQQRGNRSVLINHSIAPVSTTAIRVVGLRGPEAQYTYVRVNELQIMGHD